jgi:hypothetical protein
MGGKFIFLLADLGRLAGCAKAPLVAPWQQSVAAPFTGRGTNAITTRFAVGADTARHNRDE